MQRNILKNWKELIFNDLSHVTEMKNVTLNCTKYFILIQDDKKHQSSMWLYKWGWSYVVVSTTTNIVLAICWISGLDPLPSQLSFDIFRDPYFPYQKQVHFFFPLCHCWKKGSLCVVFCLWYYIYWRLHFDPVVYRVVIN